MIGDPSGRKTARVAQDELERTANTTKIYTQLSQIFRGAEKELKRQGQRQPLTGQWELYNNSSWLHKAPMMDIMRLLLPGIRLGTMLGRDT